MLSLLHPGCPKGFIAVAFFSYAWHAALAACQARYQSKSTDLGALHPRLLPQPCSMSSTPLHFCCFSPWHAPPAAASGPVSAQSEGTQGAPTRGCLRGTSAQHRGAAAARPGLHAALPTSPPQPQHSSKDRRQLPVLPCGRGRTHVYQSLC